MFGIFISISCMSENMICRLARARAHWKKATSPAFRP
jgi:hypothetical protein